MAWTLHYQCCFQSRTGTQYAVNIYEQGYSGSVVQLTGAENPFTTRENDADDIFTPVRGQTGYLRVIDTDGTLLEQILPLNNTEKRVTLYSGTYSGTWPNGAFTASNLMWAGFLCAQAFTQPWFGGAKMIELPVKSILSAMEDVYFPQNVGVRYQSIALCLYQAFYNVGFAPSWVHIISDFYNPIDILLQQVSTDLFYEQKTGNYNDPALIWNDSLPFSEVLSKICRYLGLTMREDGVNFYLAKYDAVNGLDNQRYGISWSDFTNIALNGAETGGSSWAVGDISIESDLTFRGSDNTDSFLLGVRQCAVTLNIVSSDFAAMTQSEYTADASPVDDVRMSDGHYLRVQSHQTNGSSQETFSYRKKLRQRDSNDLFIYTDVAASTYSTCKQNSILEGPIAPVEDENGRADIYTGAFPCRWYYQADDSAASFQNGLFIVQTSPRVSPFLPSGSDTEADSEKKPIYSLTAANTYEFKDCYINIKMNASRALLLVFVGIGQTLSFQTGNIPTSITCRLGIDSCYWNGTAWVGDSSATFEIEFLGQEINYTNSIEGVDGSGWFIPVNNGVLPPGIESLNGAPTFTILDCSAMKGWSSFMMSYGLSYAAIISGLEVGIVYPSLSIAAKRNSNTYQQVMASGFSGDNEITLDFGTFNQNVSSPSFVRDKNGFYVTNILYRYLDGQQVTTKNIRPEMQLLARMVQQYQRTRRTLKAVAESGLYLFDARFNYNNRHFFGISQNKNWREETQEVKFIEVT